MATTLSEAMKDPVFKKWWDEREKFIEIFYRDKGDHQDTYLITIQTEAVFSRENDGVVDELDVEMWLRVGEIELDPGYKIIDIKKVKS
jgi:hypothetical protein